MKAPVIFALVLSCVAAPAGALGFTFFTYRYRLIVEIEVDGQIKTDSSVVQMRWISQPAGLAGGRPWAASVTGQAPLVDLGKHGAMAAALAGASDGVPIPFEFLALHAFDVFPKKPRTFPPTEDGLRAVYKKRGKVALRADNLPMFVWLPDPAMPDTAVPLLPDEFSSKIAPGVRFRAAWLEVTNDPISTELAARLPWLPELYEKQQRLWIQKAQRPVPTRCHLSDPGLRPVSGRVAAQRADAFYSAITVRISA